MANTCLVKNGVPQPIVHSVSTFLETHPGAYTTSRTHKNASFVVFWERHLQRLEQSVRILAESMPHLFPENPNFDSSWDSVIKPLIQVSMRNGLVLAFEERENKGEEEEFALTALVAGGLEEDGEKSKCFDVFVHIGVYAPLVFGVNSARLALVGGGREMALSKHSQWVRTRKYLEKLRPPRVTELLLSNNGDQILEGNVTNFFVVCRKDMRSSIHDYKSGSGRWDLYEVQTAPISDGVLPGILRQLVIEVCFCKGISLLEVAPSWSKRDTWEEAFVTNSLRILQHVESIQAPCTWDKLHIKSYKDLSWEEIHFEGPGLITSEIQIGIMERMSTEGYPIHNFLI
ncbi:uncharacterized protein LOC18423694 isoform X1 [Amborella trichopoda]|uniref:uncharacterized protein LOC18423694 isoform X1 n=1 Tax=Amborella trichopoda TaxID=13333 RepID=UPI0009BF6B7D|nr:uncharacterized protein LOC18423694 isoform X1 [Amborella trichopoda]XP_020529863.1 uncharacterized protein LOC18423694 isoform X1 [Amborella trichopoda]XP_020529867.1 uncharacterized protein LOC18423694 isoform X1 [Amborella trichopoda]XP_020529869.1 uncharacterized protein LOC18423694 isoform X1 [Amborella trichopoda]XP_020529870.1 uncharacterized protein LOC18423694 isoform X1 [Amborella trichopoda]|eukprot:XP_020529855.1 uncharacterized protein LOC18423694 isoform X1 [Amborella trichopoda]